MITRAAAGNVELSAERNNYY